MAEDAETHEPRIARIRENLLVALGPFDVMADLIVNTQHGPNNSALFGVVQSPITPHPRSSRQNPLAEFANNPPTAQVLQSMQRLADPPLSDIETNLPFKKEKKTVCDTKAWPESSSPATTSSEVSSNFGDRKRKLGTVKTHDEEDHFKKRRRKRSGGSRFGEDYDKDVENRDWQKPCSSGLGNKIENSVESGITMNDLFGDDKKGRTGAEKSNKQRDGEGVRKEEKKAHGWKKEEGESPDSGFVDETIDSDREHSQNPTLGSIIEEIVRMPPRLSPPRQPSLRVPPVVHNGDVPSLKCIIDLSPLPPSERRRVFSRFNNTGRGTVLPPRPALSPPPRPTSKCYTNSPCSSERNSSPKPPLKDGGVSSPGTSKLILRISKENGFAMKRKGSKSPPSLRKDVLKKEPLSRVASPVPKQRDIDEAKDGRQNFESFSSKNELRTEAITPSPSVSPVPSVKENNKARKKQKSRDVSPTSKEKVREKTKEKEKKYRDGESTEKTKDERDQLVEEGERTREVKGRLKEEEEKDRAREQRERLREEREAEEREKERLKEEKEKERIREEKEKERLREEREKARIMREEKERERMREEKERQRILEEKEKERIREEQEKERLMREEKEKERIKEEMERERIIKEQRKKEKMQQEKERKLQEEKEKLREIKEKNREKERTKDKQTNSVMKNKEKFGKTKVEESRSRKEKREQSAEASTSRKRRNDDIACLRYRISEVKYEIIRNEDGSLKSASYYEKELARPKKHTADKMDDKVLRCLHYLDSVAYFIISCGLQAQNDVHGQGLHSQMVRGTSELLKNITNRFVQSSSYTSLMTHFVGRIKMLSSRAQAILQFQLYSSRSQQALKNLGILAKFDPLLSELETAALRSDGSVTSGDSQSVRSAATPSPASSTHSTNAERSKDVTVPLYILQTQRSQLSILHHLMWAYRMWHEQDTAMGELESEMSEKLDAACGRLTVESDMILLSEYLATGVSWLMAEYELESADQGHC